MRRHAARKSLNLDVAKRDVHAHLTLAHHFCRTRLLGGHGVAARATRRCVRLEQARSDGPPAARLRQRLVEHRRVVCGREGEGRRAASGYAERVVLGKEWCGGGGAHGKEADRAALCAGSVERRVQGRCIARGELGGGNGGGGFRILVGSDGSG
eukprot:6186952-Pleurochrysis_carterae.AAC.1